MPLFMMGCRCSFLNSYVDAVGRMLHSNYIDLS